MDLKKISAVVQPYLWGDSYFIPQLLQRKKSDSPQAELWMGTHPQGPSKLKGEDETLQQFIESSPNEILGPSHIEKFGKTLPFLFKVLAIKEPLSLQVHPSSSLAIEGYQKEQELRGTVDISQLNYKDDKQKDEVLYALSPVTAMAGFKPIEEIKESFSLFLDDLSLIFSGNDSIESFFLSLLQLEGERKQKLIHSLKEYVSKNKEENFTTFLSPCEIAQRALELYEDDIMVCAPFFLNVVHLEPGQALHVTPRTLHAYVYGHATELMSCSDNVLRGGLTHKKVDVAELLKVVQFESSEPHIVPSQKDGDSVETIDVNSDEFIYHIYHPGTIVQENRESIEMALVIEGSPIFSWENKELRCTKGDIVCIPSSISHYSVVHNGLIVSACVPLQNK